MGETPRGQEKSKGQDLEDRLIGFAAAIIGLVEMLPNTREGDYVAGQLMLAGTTPAPCYCVAQRGTSRERFINGLKDTLRALREAHVWLRIVLRKHLIKPSDRVEAGIDECDTLIRIFSKSVSTAEGRGKKDGRDN